MVLLWIIEQPPTRGSGGRIGLRRIAPLELAPCMDHMPLATDRSPRRCLGLRARSVQRGVPSRPHAPRSRPSRRAKRPRQRRLRQGRQARRSARQGRAGHRRARQRRAGHRLRDRAARPLPRGQRRRRRDGHARPRPRRAGQQIIKDPKTNERFQNLLREKNVPDAGSRRRRCRRSSSRSLQRGHDRAAAARGPLRQAAAVPQGGPGGADRGAPQAAGGQAARRRGQRGRGQAHHQGHRRAQQDDRASSSPSTSRARASTSPTMRERFKAQHAWREVIRRRFGARSPSPSATSTACSSASATRGRRGHGRVAGAEDHAADAGQASTRPRWPSASPRPRPCAASSTAARPWQASPRTPPTPSSRTSSRQAEQHPRADAIDAALRQGRRMLPPATVRDRHRDLCRVRPAGDQGRRQAARESAMEELQRRRSSRSWPSATCATCRQDAHIEYR